MINLFKCTFSYETCKHRFIMSLCMLLASSGCMCHKNICSKLLLHLYPFCNSKKYFEDFFCKKTILSKMEIWNGKENLSNLAVSNYCFNIELIRIIIRL